MVCRLDDRALPTRKTVFKVMNEAEIRNESLEDSSPWKTIFGLGLMMVLCSLGNPCHWMFLSQQGQALIAPIVVLTDLEDMLAALPNDA